MQTSVRSQAINIWTTYAYWFFWVSVAFFAVYPSANWLTAQREGALSLFVRPELHIPFVPEFVWIYLSLYVLFFIPPFVLDQTGLRRLGQQLVAATVFCGVIFLLLPAKLGFPRTIPEDPFYGSLFGSMFTVDLPHNMVPSLHVVFSTLILLSVFDRNYSPLAKAVVLFWLILICASTVLVHQHHLLDVVTGLLVAMTFRHLIGKGDSHV